MQRKINLDFKPCRAWPKALPAYVWGDYTLCGFKSETELPLNTANTAFLEAFYAIYPQLTFPEHSRFYNLASQLDSSLPFTWQEYFQAYKMRWCENLKENLLIMSSLPAHFEEWCSNKDVKQRDLAIFRSIKDIKICQPILDELVTLNANKNTGMQILETSIELLLMGKPIDLLVFKTEAISAEQWAKRLYRIRYPMSTMNDEAQSQKVKQLPWPQKVQAKWIRVGDESGVEIKFFIKDTTDLDKRLSGLNYVRNLLDKDKSEFWSK